MSEARRNSLKDTPIAIVGLASIAPQARNLQEFWENIVHEIDCITDVPASHWPIEDYYDPDPSVPDKTYSRRGGFLPAIDFDPLEYGLPPNILEVTDTSQLLSLVAAKQALQDAGYGDQLAPFDREHTGVIVGVGGGQTLYTPLTTRLQYPIWERVLRSAGLTDEETNRLIEKIKLAYIPWEENSFPGMLGNVIAGRIANRLDLGGINCVVDAACASSLAALRMAVNELVDGRAEMMLVGGVDTDNSIFMYLCFSKTPAFSQANHSRPFDIESDGMLIGEAVAFMVLKRLEDAERDGDRIYAVIRGMGASSDGRFKSIYAPRSEGQERALVRAYADAEVSPTTIGLIEAHGTGTVAGDQCEVTTLAKVFAESGVAPGSVALGSIKSQIGHTKSAAGAVSLAKVALALHHKVLPASINVAQPNPRLGFEGSPLYVNKSTRPWLRGAHQPPRRAGVSSFGFGGTNYHVILEEYTREHAEPYRLHRAPQEILLSAPDHANLVTSGQSLLDALHGDQAESTFIRMANTHRAAIIPLESARLGFVASTPAEAAALLEVALQTLRSQPERDTWSHPKGIHYRRKGMDTAGKVVALFPGQGSQYPDMGLELAVNFPIVREVAAYMDSLFSAEGLPPLSDVIYPVPAFNEEDRRAQSDLLQRTEHTQPAIGVLSVSLFRLLQFAGFKPDFVAGHSFGELTALWAAGVLLDHDYLTLAKARGQAMAPPSAQPGFDPGTMAAVTGDLTRLPADLAAFADVQIANWNAYTQAVIAGPTATVEAARQTLETKGYQTTRLPVSAAFHTPLVGHAHHAFAASVRKVSFKTAAVPVFSNTTAQAYPADPASIQEMLAAHLLKPVYFFQEVENLYAAGARVFVEVGPRSVLTNLLPDILGDRPYESVALNPSRQKDSDRQFREAAVQLRVIGLPMHSVDPYQLPLQDPADRPQPKVNIPIMGVNYVSPKTRQAFENALEDGYRISRHIIADALSPSQVAEERIITDNTALEIGPFESIELRQRVTMDENKPSDELDRSLAQFIAHQGDILRAHEQHLVNQAEYIKMFSHLVEQQQALIMQYGGQVPASVLESLSQSLSLFHEQQAQALRVHEQYLKDQADTLRAIFDLIQQQYGHGRNLVGNGSNGYSKAAIMPPVSAPSATPLPVPPPPAPPPPVSPVVSPPPAITAPRPLVSSAPPAPPAPPVLPSPAVTQAAPGTMIDRNKPVMPAPPPPPAIARPSSVPAGTPAVSAVVPDAALATALLEVVSEKTGYPADMLELDMDIEADLGIDSIKRVEILAALRGRFPSLPEVEPEDLARLATLGQIVMFMSQSATPAAETPSSVAVSVPAIPASTPAVSAVVPDAALATALLEVVSEKTGYPADMLELDMDIEADLGIDSIKRVEILAALRGRFPSLPEVEPEDLARLATLGQIVGFMQEDAKKN